MESEDMSNPTPESESPSSNNFFNRLGGVYFTPGETFKEIGRSPQVLIPIIVLIVIGLLAGYYLTKNLDLQSMMAEQLENAVKQGRMTQEQMEQQMSFLARFVGIQVLVSAALGSLVISLIIAAFAKLFSIMSGADNRFKTLFSVTLYAMIAVSIVQSALLILVLHFKGPGDVSITNIGSVVASNLRAVLAGLLGEDALPKFLMNLAGYVDLFAIWMIALLAIGYSAVSRKLKTSTAAKWLVAAYAVIAVIGSYVAMLGIPR